MHAEMDSVVVVSEEKRHSPVFAFLKSLFLFRILSLFVTNLGTAFLTSAHTYKSLRMNLPPQLTRVREPLKGTLLGFWGGLPWLQVLLTRLLCSNALEKAPVFWHFGRGL